MGVRRDHANREGQVLRSYGAGILAVCAVLVLIATAFSGDGRYLSRKDPANLIFARLVAEHGEAKEKVVVVR